MLQSTECLRFGLYARERHQRRSGTGEVDTSWWPRISLLLSLGTPRLAIIRRVPGAVPGGILRSTGPSTVGTWQSSTFSDSVNYEVGAISASLPRTSAMWGKFKANILARFPAIKLKAPCTPNRPVTVKPTHKILIYCSQTRLAACNRHRYNTMSQYSCFTRRRQQTVRKGEVDTCTVVPRMAS